MFYSGVNKFDIANGPGIRISLFVSGCSFYCKNCFNQEAQSFTNGSLYTPETEQKILSLLSNPYVRGLSLLGGDPLWQAPDDIREWLIPLVQRTKLLNKDVWIWTGFTWEEIFKKEPHGSPQTIQDAVQRTQQRARQELISLCDVLVDGRFIDEQKDLTLPYCGSRNQRVIDIQKTLKNKNGEIILYEK